jgi:hypothetical protein
MEKRALTYYKALEANYVHASRLLPQKEDAPRRIDNKTICTF